MKYDLSYIQILKEEFKNRQDLNSKYSLRAFARDLGLSPSRLSEVLNGQGGLSGQKARGVAKSLGLNFSETELFLALIESEHGRSEKIKNKAKALIESKNLEKKYKSLTADAFKVIGNWYHFAILSVMELDDFDGTVEFMASKLGLNISLISDAIERLINLELIEVNEIGLYNPIITTVKTTSEISSLALRNSHKQSLKQAIKSLDTIPIEKRDITSMTMAIDESKIEEAKRRIKSFRRDICEFLENGKKTSVYNINIQLLPVNVEQGAMK